MYKVELSLSIPSLVFTQQICYRFPVAFPAVLQLVLRSLKWQFLCPSVGFCRAEIGLEECVCFWEVPRTVGVVMEG